MRFISSLVLKCGSGEFSSWIDREIAQIIERESGESLEAPPSQL
jgi:hypothetical protein